VIGQTITFTGTASGTGPLNYAWDFDDGSPAGSGAVVTHAYNDDQSYNVQLTVTNCGGAGSDSDNQSVIVDPYRLYLPLVLRNF
jgi:PKD repeat protein